MMVSKKVFLHLMLHLGLCCACAFGIRSEPQPEQISEMKCEFTLIDWVDADEEIDGERTRVRFTLRRFAQYRESAESFRGKMYYTSGYVVSATKESEAGVASELMWLIPDPRVHMVYAPPVNFDLGDMVWEPETRLCLTAPLFGA